MPELYVARTELWPYYYLDEDYGYKIIVDENTEKWIKDTITQFFAVQRLLELKHDAAVED
jgi:hypothetical protein